MSDLRYRHILDNLAMMVRNPATVPNPVAINGGVVQISDNVTGIGNITINPAFTTPSNPITNLKLPPTVSHKASKGLWAAGLFPNSGL